MHYSQAAAWLDQRQMFTIKLGLDTTRSLLAELGNPQDRLRCIHIAGTNGKGSVGAMLQSMLSAGGHRTGFYSSPHLSSVRERFTIDGNPIPEADFARLVTRLAHLIDDGQLNPTYFECATLLALLWFAEQETQAVILETGMGGRLDATNVVTPILVILTDISRDHEQYLGQTLQAIAEEKAGIIKQDAPVLFSGRARETLPVIEARCREQRCPLFLAGREFGAFFAPDGQLHYLSFARVETGPFPLALRGAYQVGNAGLALAAIEVLAPLFPVKPDQIMRGLQQVRWPGRMELFSVPGENGQVRVLLDGAHNEAGVDALAESLRKDYPRERLLVLWGAMTDKNMGAALDALMRQADLLLLTRAAETRRAAPPETLLAGLPSDLQARARCVPDCGEALAQLLSLASEQDLLCVAGSLYLVGRVRELLLERMS